MFQFRFFLFSIGFTYLSIIQSNAQNTIVAEPDRPDYVRVCDVYGSGFFFIPGTETCIRLGGFVRSSYEHFEVAESFEFVNTPGRGPSPGNFSFQNEFQLNLWGQQAALDVDTRTETDWGTLRSLFRLEAGPSNSDADVRMDVALISLAGFRVGYTGATYWSSNHNFGSVDTEPIASFTGPNQNSLSVAPVDGFYGFNAGTILDYTWSQDGLSLTFGIEDLRLIRDGGNNISNNGFPSPIISFNNAPSTDNSVNFYAGINYSSANVEVALTAVRDALAFDPVTQEEGGWAYKASAHIDLSQAVPGVAISGYYLTDGGYRTDYVHTNGLLFNPAMFFFNPTSGLENPDRIWGVVLNSDFSDEFGLWLNYWRAESAEARRDNDPLFSRSTDNNAVLNMLGVGFNWYPKAAPGFSVKGAYINGEVEALSFATSGFATNTTSYKANFDGFRVTLRRDF